MAGAPREGRLLVVGGAGMLGHMACRTLADGFEVHATCRRAWDEEPDLGRVIAAARCVDRCDAVEGERIRGALRELRPAFVLNAVGVIKQKPGAEDPALSIAVNALFPHRLAAWCAEIGAKLVQVSTDCVFSGARGSYAETDAPDAADLYGRSKLLGEVAQPPHLTLRTSMIGRQLRGREGLLEWFVAQRGGRVRGFTRAIFSGLTTRALCRLIGRTLRDAPRLAGVYHVAAAPISKFDLLCRVDRRLGLGVRVDPDDSLVCDRSLDGTRFVRDTGAAAPDWDTMLEEIADDRFRYSR